MKHCKTCKWWRESDKDDYANYDTILFPYRPDTMVQTKNEAEQIEVYGHLIRYCENPKMFFSNHRAIDFAAPIYDGGETASLITGEEFGCVLHEEKSQ